jgi:signal transduction histidine kinase
MSPPPLPPTKAPTPRTAWRHRMRQEMLIAVVTCTSVAVLLTLVTPHGWGLNLTYSFCIGVPIQAQIQIGRSRLGALRSARGVHAPGRDRDWPGWDWMAPWIVLSVLTGFVGGSALADALTGGSFLADSLAGDRRSSGFILAVALLASLSATYVFYARSRIAHTEMQAETARRQAAEHQLKLLESQLEPHMLFNTLATLRALIGSDPAQARELLDRINAYLRATLQASRRAAHPLSEEFARTADYLSLMKLRMGPRLNVHLDLPAELSGAVVPPLLLQPLVENAIKHGLEPHVEGGELIVRARRVADALSLTVRDTGVGLSEPALAPPGTGFGLQQVRERLLTLHGTSADLQIAEADDGRGGTCATLRLPLVLTPPAP